PDSSPKSRSGSACSSIYSFPVGDGPRKRKTTNAAPWRSKAFLPGWRRCLFSTRQDARRLQRRPRGFGFTSFVPTAACGDKVSINQWISRQGQHLDTPIGLGRSALPNSPHAEDFIK